MKKRILSPLMFLVIKIRKNIQSTYKKKCCEKKLVDLLLRGEEAKRTMFLSKILIHLCMIRHYIVEENFFVVIVYNFSIQNFSVMRKHFNKKIVETKEDDENSAKCWICHNAHVDGNFTVRDHCHITKKYRGSVHRGCNINVKF